MRFYFRLEAPDGSGHFRSGTIYSDSLDEARAALTRQEEAKVRSFLSDDDLAKIEAKIDENQAAAKAEDPKAPADAGFWALPGGLRGQLVIHRQTKPYEISYLDTTEPPRDPARKPGDLAAQVSGKEEA